MTANDWQASVHEWMDWLRGTLNPGVTMGEYLDRLPEQFAAELALWIDGTIKTKKQRRRRKKAKVK